MPRFKVENGRAVAKRMLKLAFDASSVVGMGVFQYRRRQKDDDSIWNEFYDKGSVVADYLNGRMMKLYFNFGDDFVESTEMNWRPDYQSFCTKYPTFESLVNA